jgi:hypothetical protein
VSQVAIPFINLYTERIGFLGFADSLRIRFAPLRHGRLELISNKGEN